jgi:hypothetical protein
MPVAMALCKVALFTTGGDQRCEKKGSYRNPKRQRGIDGDTCKIRQLNSSLRCQVVMAAHSQLQNLRFRLVLNQWFSFGGERDAWPSFCLRLRLAVKRERQRNGVICVPSAAE